MKDPFTIPLAEFRSFSPEEQDALRQEAIKRAHVLVDYYLIRAQYHWILLCGDTNCIRTFAPNAREMPAADLVSHFEEAMGFPAYGVYRHEVIP